jgi:hypothetical protein
MQKYTEKKVSLVGWGEWQVMLHVINGNPGVSVVKNNRITMFGVTPWLKGLIGVVRTTARYCHGQVAQGDCADLVLQMRQSAFEDAVQAVLNQDVPLLAEAVMTTYMAQQQMGAELLPHKGEIAKRFSGHFGVYLFSKPSNVSAEIKLNAVMAV